MAPVIHTYSFENITNSSSNKLLALFQETSRQTDYFPGIIIISALWFIIFLSLKGKGYATLNALSAANTAFLIITILMYPLGILPGSVLVISICLFVISIPLLFILNSD